MNRGLLFRKINNNNIQYIVQKLFNLKTTKLNKEQGYALLAIKINEQQNVHIFIR